jgi:cytochrome c6
LRGEQDTEENRAASLDTRERMRFGSLAIAVAAGTAGVLLGYYVSGERSGVTAMTGGRTVTVTKTVVRTMARPDPREGKRVFVTVCSRCHTFEPGDWTGNRVNLTELQTSYRLIVDAVTGGGIAMPSFEGKLSEREIRDVAAFVRAEAAGRRARLLPSRSTVRAGPGQRVTRHSARLRTFRSRPRAGIP